MGTVYILKSLRNGRFYIGSTKAISKRLEQHQTGQVKATKFLRPLEAVFTQHFDSLSTARGIEYKLKALKRKDFIERIIKDGTIKLMGL